MRLQVTRLDARRYETVITRADGVTWHVKGVGHMGTIPHDLAHYVTERTLGIRGGFWGSVAEGAVFGSLTHVRGRRKPHATDRSRAILKRNRDDLTATEILVGLFEQAAAEGLGAESLELRARLRRYAWVPAGRERRTFTDAQVSSVCDAWAAMLAAWQQLPIGGVMHLEWSEGSG